MSGLEAPIMSWSLVVVQSIGLLSAWLARLSEGSSCQTSCQRFFLACLVLVGMGTIASLALAPGCWLASGATFSLMVVATTCDFRRCRRPMGC